MSPTLALLVLIMRGIVAGVFTATEPSAVAVFYSLGLSFFYREMRLRELPGVLLETATTTGIAAVMTQSRISQSTRSARTGFVAAARRPGK